VLNKLYLQAGRDAVRTFLRSIKEQLAPRLPAARAPAPPAAVFALASSLAVAAERLRQFSPVKGHDKLGAVVLDELRLRLFRIVSGGRGRGRASAGSRAARRGAAARTHRRRVRPSTLTRRWRPVNAADYGRHVRGRHGRAAARSGLLLHSHGARL
jgi:hypothetical protein